jgi:hypothetical protein
MLSTQTMASTSFFSDPFHNPRNDPRALGSYTTCEGPATKPQTSPVAKIRKQIISAFAPKHPLHSTDFLKPEPQIVSLPFVAEDSTPPTRACSPTPACNRNSKRPASSNKLEPLGAFDSNNMMQTVADDILKQPKPSRKLRHFSSRTTIADMGGAASTSLLRDDTIVPTLTPIHSRPSTAAGDFGYLPRNEGSHGTSGHQCPCSCAKCRCATAKLCKCACSCKNCHCKGRKAPNRFLRILEDHGFGRKRTSNIDAESGEKKCGKGQMQG